MTYEYLIVGSGFAGSVMARQLADAGKRVLIIDKRDHIGGNAYDYVNEVGVRIHKYGPHIFHTNSERVFAYLSRFTEWRPYEHRVLASVCGKLLPFPINIDTLNQLYGLDLDEPAMRAFLAERVARDWPEGKQVKTAEDQIVSQIGRELFELFFAGYTQKMWGVPASELDKSVTARIPVRFDHDDRYFTDKHQAMPKDGYTQMFERMLDSPNITVRLGRTAPAMRSARTILRSPMAFIPHETIKEGAIWTGPIDEYFAYCFGRLPYRSMRFHHKTAAGIPGATAFVQPAAVVNWPDARIAPTRTTEWKWFAAAPQRPCATTLTEEYPEAEGEPFYPIPSPESAALYAKYEALARERSDVIFLGRLGRYQYINMDAAVGQALTTFERMKIGQAA